jgi:glucose/mannose-6-phosphate isomerase
MSVTNALDRTAIAQVDTADILADVLDMPAQLRDALWRVESAGLEPHDSPGGLVVAGMGGSAIGGRLAGSILGERATRPIVLANDYGLPPGTTPDTTVLCASYSGNTEETLAAYDAAAALGARRVVVTTGGRLAELARADGVPVIPIAGGMQPRVAVAYMTVAALEMAALSGTAPSLHSEIDVAAAHAERLVEEWGPDGAEDSLAKSVARALHGTIPLVAGSGITAAIAYRWKTQINEMAKTHAFSHELPELDHNELVGWEGAREVGPFAAIFLDDPDLHPRVRDRIDLTRRLIEGTAEETIVVRPPDGDPAERVIALVLLGDLVSVYVAVLRGVDPTPVAVLEQLKGELARR